MAATPVASRTSSPAMASSTGSDARRPKSPVVETATTAGSARAAKAAREPASSNRTT